MQNFIEIITILSWALLFVLVIKVVVFITFSFKHFKFHAKKDRKRIGKYKPLVSIIIPCYNEEMTLKNCVESLIRQSYPYFEIIVVNDGSKDNTEQVAQELVKLHNKVKFYSKPNGGKASALNYGIMQALGEIVVCIDADSMFLKDTLRQLVLSFYNPNVIAVGGNVRVANRSKFLNKHQAVEYITGLNLQRRTFAYLDCMQVISGAVGAFRKNKLLEVGGYSNDTIVEDMDITVSLARAGYKVEYNGKAIAYTEAPETIKDFLKQRYRWTYGGFQVLKKHKDLLFNPKYGKFGLIGMPYFLLFPWLDVIISLLFLFALIRVVTVGGLKELAIFYFFMCLIQGLLMFFSIFMDREDKKLAVISGIESLWYNHLISFVTVEAGINYMRGVQTSWNKVARLGKNYLPTTSRELTLAQNP